KSKAANEAFRQKRLAQGDQITKAVKTLVDSVAARRVLDEEAAVRARETAPPNPASRGRSTTCEGNSSFRRWVRLSTMSFVPQ
ncbi:unnamed protein product, partial [Pylaiella littoralis]